MDINRLSRREALRAVGLLAGGVALNSACASRVRPYVTDPPAQSHNRLRRFAPVNVAAHSSAEWRRSNRIAKPSSRSWPLTSAISIACIEAV